MKITVNRILLLVLGISYIVIILLRRSIYSTGLVDWDTIAILSSLIVVNTGLMYTGGLNYVAYTIMKFTNGRRKLMIISILLTSLVAMFLTNDVSLLVLIPITIAIGRFAGKNIDDVIIFQAIAANVGSMLMPFGNPQNIIMFRLFSLNFFEFVRTMAPIFLVSMIILVLFSLVFKDEKFVSQENAQKPHAFFFALFAALLVSTILGMLLNAPIYLFVVVIAVSMVSLMLFEPKTIVKVDYILIVVFILIFLVMNSVRLLVTIPTLDGMQSFLSSILLSQVISNVPTTVLLGKASSFAILSYGVNIGGNGTVVASLANIIALRNLSGKNFLKFNKYSFLFLAVTAVAGFLILFK
ncbi:MAG: Citrate transporter [Thermoplasmatales archaeon I-plasma]|jgi:Na+/H+ antiporter NhaD and related arsenite permeases|nr:MAG: Citrate transporter [Thermoplasmatales archaeon I-plasma]